MFVTFFFNNSLEVVGLNNLKKSLLCRILLTLIFPEETHTHASAMLMLLLCVCVCVI